MTVRVVTAENLGRGLAVGTVTPGKVELDLGAGLVFADNKLAPAAKRCLFVRRTGSVQAIGPAVDLLFNTVQVANGISYAPASGIATVPGAAGVVWRVTLTLHLSQLTTNAAGVALVSGSNAELYPGAQVAALAPPAAVQAAGAMTIDVLYASATTWTVKARAVSGAANLRIDAHCGLIIQEL
jgi:hypothetical protein